MIQKVPTKLLNCNIPVISLGVFWDIISQTCLNMWSIIPQNRDLIYYPLRMREAVSSSALDLSFIVLLLLSHLYVFVCDSSGPWICPQSVLLTIWVRFGLFSVGLKGADWAVAQGFSHGCMLACQEYSTMAVSPCSGKWFT